jgi:tRNA (cytidine/uridine-2'-O-)-methyltransferase
VGGDLVAALRSAPGGEVLLIDALGTYLAHHLGKDEASWEQEVRHLQRALAERRQTVIVVCEEVGWGVVPPTAVGGLFRDRLGRLHDQLEGLASESWLVLHGRAVNLTTAAERVPEGPPARVVLMEPRIPPNTGNIARTCAGLRVPLHLVEPLGFSLDDRQLRRAGLDYWPWVDLSVHASLEALQAQRTALGGRLVAFSRHAGTSLLGCRFRQGDWLLFGREDRGLPPEVIARADLQVRIPMPGGVASGGGVRSFNLSSACAMGLFEALRQTDQRLS